MSAKKEIDASIWVVAIIGSLILVNLVGLEVFARLDLTRDQQFTLSGASRSTLRNLPGPVTVRAYFTEDMPPPYSTNARYVRDLFDEYYASAGGNFKYEFIDPVKAESEEDKEKKKDVKQDIFGRQYRESTPMEQELQTLGIPPLQVRVNEEDSLEVKRVYMGLAIEYDGKTDVIPVVQRTETLEYDLTTIIRKMARDKTPKVAFLGGHDGLDLQQELQKVSSMLSQLYEVVPLDLSADPAVPEDVDAVVIAGPKTPLSVEEQQAIDAYIVGGGSVAFLLDSVKPNLEQLQSEPAIHGVGDMLETYGVKIEPGLVLDTECATIGIMEQRGFMRIQQPVQYPFMPLAKSLDPDHPLTRGLPQIAFPFMNPLTITAQSSDEVGGIKAEVLATSSEHAWVQDEPYNLDPRQRWTRTMMGEQGKKNLLVTLSGNIPSHFQPGVSAAEHGARILVAGGASFVQDQFLNQSGQTFALNLMDWLLLDEALLAMRSRGLSAAPLDEISGTSRNALKYGNIFGLPFFVIALGLIRWRRREARRSQVSL